MKYLNALKGYRTFIIAGLMVILGILKQDMNMVMEGLAIGFLRAGINSK